MLSPSRCDEDDDSHLCIKCNNTIIGLDNYVKHRREICGKRKYDVIKTQSKSIAIEPLEPTYSLGADVFFQSLELQSSVKKTSISHLTPPVSAIKTISNERKSSLNVVPSTSRDTPRMSPLETNLRGEDWIGGHTLRIGANEDNQTRLINVVNNISGVSKKDSPTTSTSYNVGYYVFKDEEYDDASEESEEEEEEEVPTTGGKWKPPSHHTGGKWRPASPDQDDWEEHAGSAWKSIMSGETQERDDDYDAPPPSHTKGKWVPGAHEQKTQIMQNTIQSKGSVQYWCGVCNRRLGSRAIYEKHLRSNLHLKKTLPETDLEFSGPMEQRDKKEKRNTRPSQYVDNTLYECAQRKRKPSSAAPVSQKRCRRQTFTHCSGCKCRVRVHLMGKHLISHYHFRKTADTSSKQYHKLILDNMHAIVHQSPFQCSPCKFYTNWMSDLMQHWFTGGHAQRTASMDGRYWCSFCKFECETSEGMLGHMTSPDHDEVVSVINRSMPIIIRKKTVFKCIVCFDEFRYNIGLKKHCDRSGHELPFTATDTYQECHKCHVCSTKYKSSLSLAAHLKNEHNRGTFHCLVCSATFGSAQEAKRHRYTSAHRIRQKERLSERGVPIKDLRKKCPYCAEKVVLKNVILLKDHIRKMHPDKKKKCSKCGKPFILPQEVTRHVRENACVFEDAADPDLLTSRVLWKCSQCPFKTTTHAECLFHEVLHSKPQAVIKNGKTKVKIEKYSCPLCSKIFTKASLRLHLRVHTFERPFACTLCPADFTRTTALNAHIKAEHGADKKPDRNPRAHGELCQSTLDVPATPQSHDQLVCPHLGCNYTTNTISKLARHRKSHGEKVKRHECPLCYFKTDQSSHLKQHMIFHEGIKPYACPHCDFVCATLANLRKHALRTSRHPGLPLYHCPHCEYTSSLAKHLKEHLLAEHSQLYSPKQAIHAAKIHLLREQFRPKALSDKD